MIKVILFSCLWIDIMNLQNTAAGQPSFPMGVARGGGGGGAIDDGSQLCMLQKSVLRRYLVNEIDCSLI